MNTFTMPSRSSTSIMLASISPIWPRVAMVRPPPRPPIGLAGRSRQLDEGNLEAILTALRRLRPRDGAVQKAVHSALHYFQSNAHRLRYADLRSQALFVGSGVVEAGCKTIIGHRLKHAACNGPFEVPMTSSLCAVCNSSADGKSSRKLEQRIRPRYNKYIVHPD